MGWPVRQHDESGWDPASPVGIHFDALLGQDILREFRSVRIDYNTQVIEPER